MAPSIVAYTVVVVCALLVAIFISHPPSDSILVKGVTMDEYTPLVPADLFLLVIGSSAILILLLEVRRCLFNQ